MDSLVKDKLAVAFANTIIDAVAELSSHVPAEAVVSAAGLIAGSMVGLVARCAPNHGDVREPLFTFLVDAYDQFSPPSKLDS